MRDLSDHPRDRLERMAEAGLEILECYRVLGKSDANVVGEILHGQDTFYEWDHYPKGDVYDWETHAQYYYHAHPVEERAGEHGHFHCFLRPKGMPAGMKPAALPGAVPPDAPDDSPCHLVAISMDRAGYPVRLFTTNRWVTGETWYAAPDVARLLDCFRMDLAHPSWPVNIWITAMIQLFHPQIEILLTRRDAAIADWRARHPGADVFEDRSLEVTSMLDISVEDQIAAVNAALKATAA
jgi:hypothetical protein